jgi:endogenous inhibitor of DNA gyrase (YacG/DUF329 family)
MASNCPTCGAPVTRQTDNAGSDGFPFCSRRCQLVDLGHWLDGAYRVSDRPVEGYRGGPVIDDDDPRRRT